VRPRSFTSAATARSSRSARSSAPAALLLSRCRRRSGAVRRGAAGSLPLLSCRSRRTACRRAGLQRGAPSDGRWANSRSSASASGTPFTNGASLPGRLQVVSSGGTDERRRRLIGKAHYDVLAASHSVLAEREAEVEIAEAVVEAVRERRTARPRQKNARTSATHVRTTFLPKHREAPESLYRSRFRRYSSLLVLSRLPALAACHAGGRGFESRRSRCENPAEAGLCPVRWRRTDAKCRHVLAREVPQTSGRRPGPAAARSSSAPDAQQGCPTTRPTPTRLSRSAPTPTFTPAQSTRHRTDAGRLALTQTAR
jgi:hypothetical protein